MISIAIIASISMTGILVVNNKKAFEMLDNEDFFNQLQEAIQQTQKDNKTEALKEQILTLQNQIEVLKSNHLTVRTFEKLQSNVYRVLDLIVENRIDMEEINELLVRTDKLLDTLSNIV